MRIAQTRIRSRWLLLCGIALVLAVTLLTVTGSFAAQAQAPFRLFVTHPSTGVAIPVTGINGALSTGVSNSFAAQSATGQTASFDAAVRQNHSIQLIVTGGPATCTYRLQGSNNNVDWYNISAADITCTATTQAFETSKPARYVRGNLSALTGGTSPTVTLHYAGQ